jgi:hypothetical protein
MKSLLRKGGKKPSDITESQLGKSLNEQAKIQSLEGCPGSRAAFSFGGKGVFKVFMRMLRHKGARHFSVGTGTLSAVITVLTPKCPFCLMAYATAVGCESIASLSTLKALSALCLVAAVSSIAFGASDRHGYGPFALGLLASIFVFIGKFRLEAPIVLFAGSGLLAVAIVWNALPLREIRRKPVCRC